MKRFFDYCYYRVSKAYRVLDDKDYCIYGSMVVFGALGLYALSLVSLIFYVLNKELTNLLIGVTLISFGIISLFFINKKKYEELEERYRNEKSSKLKGWLVFLFIISSLILYIVSIAILNM